MLVGWREDGMDTAFTEMQAGGGDAASHEARLDSYAQVAVQVGLGLQPGQELIVSAPVEALPLVRSIAIHAYRAGAKYVLPLLTDPQLTLARLEHAGDNTLDYAPGWFFEAMAQALLQGAARLTVMGEDPLLLMNQPPARVARTRTAFALASRPIMEILQTVGTNWATIAFATPAWAKRVFPDLSETEAVARLWDAVFRASRIEGPDAVAAWRAHARRLEERAGRLNSRRYAGLHFKGAGTDLRLRLPEDHLWQGGSATSRTGIACSPNIPSEEVFTTPHRESAEGRVVLTRPLSMQGMLIEGASLTFAGGRVVGIEASRGGDLLRAAIAADAGAAFLGEVGLVPSDSAVSSTGVLFYNTLFDENAGSHVALGQSFDKCMRGGETLGKAELVARGANQSAIHIDCVIGSAKVDVDGLTVDGGREAVMSAGTWAPGLA
ncbi:MAG: aminopeptidase [Sphingomonadales bacterium]|jgi:aminopeptidase|nr:aminopeptidase [Sphingomonadales bacterium]